MEAEVYERDLSLDQPLPSTQLIRRHAGLGYPGSLRKCTTRAGATFLHASFEADCVRRKHGPGRLRHNLGTVPVNSLTCALRSRVGQRVYGVRRVHPVGSWNTAGRRLQAGCHLCKPTMDGFGDLLALCWLGGAEACQHLHGAVRFTVDIGRTGARPDAGTSWCVAVRIRGFGEVLPLAESPTARCITKKR